MQTTKKLVENAWYSETAHKLQRIKHNLLFNAKNLFANPQTIAANYIHIPSSKTISGAIITIQLHSAQQ